jgi:hypothetical protein
MGNVFFSLNTSSNLKKYVKTILPLFIETPGEVVCDA